MKLITQEQGIPKRKHRDRKARISLNPDVAGLLAYVLHGKLRPQEAVALLLSKKDTLSSGYKYPWRAASDYIKKQIKAAGLEADYRVAKFEAETGDWVVRVSHEPVITTAPPTPRVLGQKNAQKHKA